MQARIPSLVRRPLERHADVVSCHPLDVCAGHGRHCLIQGHQPPWASAPCEDARARVLLILVPVARRVSRAGSDPPTWIADRYQLGEVVGRGGMGEVRAATDVRLEREVAVKLLRADLAEIDEVRGRFEGEARAAAALVHPHVVAVFDAGEEDGAPYIVMERLPGRTLADELKTGPLSSFEVRDLALSVLGALDAAHRSGIVHRDVKPGNVLLAGDGSWKVADFGIAKIAEAAGDLTVTGMMVGTPAYVAPERLEGEPATPASDLYSTGVILYEALTGRRAFAADNSLALAEQIRAGRAPALRSVLPDVEPRLGTVVERAMETDPGRRFASASEMRRALEGRSARARRAPRTDDETQPRHIPAATRTRALPTAVRPTRRARTARWLWLVVAVAVLFALGFAGVWLWQRDSDTASPPPAPTTVATPGANVPPALDRALDDLREAVQP
jgi:Protein kinase domain